MSGTLLQKARIDFKKYVTGGGFEDDIILETADGSLSISITGFVSRHWISFVTDGLDANSKSSHVCIDEELLIENNYPYKNSYGDVHLKYHKVSVKDSAGILKKYVINEWFDNQTFGLIPCILGEYEQS